MADGIHLNERDRDEQKKEESAALTLGQVWDAYQRDRNLRPATIKVYGIALRLCFSDWLDQPITTITKDAVVQRHSELLSRVGPRSSQSGAKAHTHQAMRVLRSLLNYTGVVYEDEEGKPLLPDNPVKRLTQAKLWQP